MPSDHAADYYFATVGPEHMSIEEQRLFMWCVQRDARRNMRQQEKK